MDVRSVRGGVMTDAWMVEGMNRGQSLLERQRWGVVCWRSGVGGGDERSC